MELMIDSANIFQLRFHYHPHAELERIRQRLRDLAEAIYLKYVDSDTNLTIVLRSEYNLGDAFLEMFMANSFVEMPNILYVHKARNLEDYINIVEASDCVVALPVYSTKTQLVRGLRHCNHPYKDLSLAWVSRFERA